MQNGQSKREIEPIGLPVMLRIIKNPFCGEVCEAEGLYKNYPSDDKNTRAIFYNSNYMNFDEIVERNAIKKGFTNKGANAYVVGEMEFNPGSKVEEYAIQYYKV